MKVFSQQVTPPELDFVVYGILAIVFGCWLIERFSLHMAVPASMVIYNAWRIYRSIRDKRRREAAVDAHRREMGLPPDVECPRCDLTLRPGNTRCHFCGWQSNAQAES